MRMLPRATVLGLVLFAFCAATPSSAQESESQRAEATEMPPLEAADLFRRTWTLIDEDLRTGAIEAYLEHGAWEPTADLASVLPGMQQALDHFEAAAREAARGNGFDWKLPKDYMVEDRALGHVPMLRAAARLLLEDAVRHANTGELSIAARRMAGALRLAASLRHDGYFFSSRVACGMVDQFALFTGKLLRDRRLDDESRTVVGEALDAFGIEDPFGFRRFFNEYADKFPVTAARAGIAAGRRDLGLPPLTDEELAVRAREAVADPSLAKDLPAAEAASLRSFFQAIDTAWSVEDATPHFNNLRIRVEAGEFHKLAVHLLPHLSNAHPAAERSATRLRQLRRLANQAPSPTR